MLTARDVLNRAFPVMPVMVIDTIDQALPMARALLMAVSRYLR
ncbi:hypothetical protein [Endozoicomonas sp. GU-1]